MKRTPSYSNTPSLINGLALNIWRQVVKNYADDIYSSKSTKDQWKKAKSHFERICTLKGVQPYVTQASFSARLLALTEDL